MIVGVHHTAIATSDLDRLSAFYRDVLGMEQIAANEWSNSPGTDAMIGLKNSSARYVLLRAGNHCFEMFEYRSPLSRTNDPDRPASDNGYTHFCLVVDDIDTEYERLKAAGMRFHTPPPRIEGSPVRAIYGRDPDGNIIELMQVVGDTPFDYAHEAVTWKVAR